MKTIIYLIQVSACTGLFYLFYKIILSRFTFFTINRWFLLISLMISFVIPAVTIPQTSPQPLTVFQPAMENIRPTGIIVISSLKEATHAPLDWKDYLSLIYGAAALALALKLAGSLFFFYLKIRNKKVIPFGNAKIIKGDLMFKNGSFINYIFLDEANLSREEIDKVLAHEMTHIRLLHSVDVLLSRLAQIVLWFNPFSYLYSRAIAENHEFETDQVICGTGKHEYAQLLLRLSVSQSNALYNHFSMIPLKKRISMLFTNPTRKMKKIIYLLVLPLAMIGCLAFANRESAALKGSGKAFRHEDKLGFSIRAKVQQFSNEKLQQFLNDLNVNGKSETLTTTNAVMDTTKVELSGSTPANYVVAPGDELLIEVYGASVVSHKLKVRSDGSINIPLVGVVQVAGLTFEQTKSRIKSSMSKTYTAMNTGETSLHVILDNKIDPSSIKSSVAETIKVAVNGTTETIKISGSKVIEGNPNSRYLSHIDPEFPAGFYNRMAMKKKDGSPYDILYLNVPGMGRMSSGAPKNSRAGFLIDSKVYGEHQVAEVERLLRTLPITGEYGVGGNDVKEISGLDLSSYGIIFYFNTDPERMKTSDVRKGSAIISGEVRTSLYTISKDKIDIGFTTAYRLSDLNRLKDELNKENIDLTYSILEFDNSGYLKKIAAAIDYNDGTKASFSSVDQLSPEHHPGFYRDLRKAPIKK